MTTKYSSAIRAANKIKNKYKKKIIGKKKPDNDDKLKKTSAKWLKSAGYLDTEDQKSISYIYDPPKGDQKNKISCDAGHFITSEIENTDLKRSDLASKITAKTL